MTSTHPTPLESALRRLLRDGAHTPPVAVAGRRRTKPRGAPPRPSSSVVQRELDQFRRGQSLPYWQHDQRSD